MKKFISLILLLIIPFFSFSADVKASSLDNVRETYINKDDHKEKEIIWAKGVIAPPSMEKDFVYAETEDANHVKYETYTAPFVNGSGYYDMNKHWTVDANLCFTATSTNLLHWFFAQNKEYILRYIAKKPNDIKREKLKTFIDSFKSQDDSAIYEYFLSNSFFYNRPVGSYEDIVLDWFINGYPLNDSDATNDPTWIEGDKLDENGPAVGGGFFYDVFGRQNLTRRADYINSFDAFARDLKAALLAGKMVTVDFKASAVSHVITLWGAEFNTSDGSISAVYIVDSDDNKTVDQGISRFRIHRDSTNSVVMTTNDNNTGGVMSYMTTLESGTDYFKTYFGEKTNYMTFDKNDRYAEGYMNKAPIIIGNKIPKCTFKKDGEKFLYWIDQYNRHWKDEDIISDKVKGELFLKAKWGIPKYTISFTSNDPLVTGSMNSIKSSENAMIKIPSNGFSRPDSNFLYFIDEKGRTYRTGDQIRLVEDLVLQPVFEAQNMAPIIYINESVEVFVNDAFNPLENAYVIDNGRKIDLTEANITFNDVNIQKAGNYTVRYEYISKTGVKTIKEAKIIVKAKPSIDMGEIIATPTIMVEDLELTVGDDYNPLANAYVLDNGTRVELTLANVISSTVNTSQAGSYKVKYQYVDSIGIKVTKEIMVTVKAKSGVDITNVIFPPEIMAPQNIELTIGDDFNPLSNIYAIDNGVKIELTKESIIYNDVNLSVAGSYKIKYSYTSKVGITAFAETIVVVKDKDSIDSPQIEASDREISIGEDFDPLANAFIVIDNQKIKLTEKNIVYNDVNPNKPGSYSVKYQYVTSSNQRLEKKITVIVKASTVEPNQDNNDTASSTMICLWAVVGVLAVFVIIGISYVIVKHNNNCRKTINRNKNKRRSNQK